MISHEHMHTHTFFQLSSIFILQKLSSFSSQIKQECLKMAFIQQKLDLEPNSKSKFTQAGFKLYQTACFGTEKKLFKPFFSCLVFSFPFFSFLDILILNMMLSVGGRKGKINHELQRTYSIKSLPIEIPVYLKTIRVPNEWLWANHSVLSKSI